MYLEQKSQMVCKILILSSIVDIIRILFLFWFDLYNYYLDFYYLLL